MEEMDFERRRELRRQKREEMRLEAERMSRNDDDEEEAARERRRRARQERMRIREAEESSAATESVPISNSHSVSESVTVSNSGGGDDEDQALQDLMAKREERRQRRLREAQERQRLLDAENSAAQVEQERSASWRRGRRGEEEEEEKTYRSRRDEEQREEEEKTYRSGRGEEQREEEEAQVEEAPDAEEEEEVEETPASAYSREQFSERARVREETRKQNGELHQEGTPDLHRKPERTLSRSSLRSPEVASAEQEQDDAARLEAEHKLEELKRRRDDAENEEFERMRQKQQEAEAELEELKRKREERKKVLEEEERHRREEEEQRRAREEEKRRMKEDIERRRAEAAEKRQKVEDGVDGETKPFKCVSPRGSSLKIGERAEFLNKSAQKSSLKTSHSPVVSKIDNRLEQYTSAAQRENRESRSPRSGATDLPAVTDNIRNIKSMWERGNVFSSPGGAAGTFKEAAVMKTGVAGRINDWLNKTPESAKASGGRPTDLKPVDVTNKRSLWENKGAKVSGRDEHKSVTNGTGH